MTKLLKRYLRGLKKLISSGWTYFIIYTFSLILIPNLWYLIIYLIIVFIFECVVIHLMLNNKRLTKYLTLYNVHVFGYRRKGKDLLTQLAIVKRFRRPYNCVIRRKIYPSYITYLAKAHFEDNQPIEVPSRRVFIYHPDEESQKFIDEYFNLHPLYLSNINYGYGARVIDLNELKLYDLNSFDHVKDPIRPGVILKRYHLLTYKDIIDGSYKKMNIPKNEMFEGLDLYLSDVQLGLPNTEFNTLDKLYPWLPVFFALSGHLYNMNIIINSQEFDRPWSKLRGQQDLYIRAVKTIPVNKSFIQRRVWSWLPFVHKYLFVSLRIYEERQSAENNTLPFSAKGILNEGFKDIQLSPGQATKEQYEATYGMIREFVIFIKQDTIKYDTRIFHKYLFNKPAPSSTTRP